MSDDSRALTEDELAKIRAEAAAAEALARKTHAEAEAAEHAAAEARIKRHKAEEEEARRCQSDDHHRVYRFSDQVSSKSADSCIAKLREWHRLDPDCDMEIIFNSPGGSVVAGMALFDEIKRLSLRGGGTHKVTAGVAGFAASMAGILVQSADVRWIGAESFFMIHEVSAQTGGKIGDMQDDVKFYEAVCDRVVKIFVERSAGKITKASFVSKWRRQDWWLLSSEALRFGFVDETR